MKPFLSPELTQCNGKRSHGTWAEAKAARGPSDRLDIYRCPHCHLFHLGSRPKGHGRPKPPPPAIELEL